MSEVSIIRPPGGEGEDVNPILRAGAFIGAIGLFGVALGHLKAIWSVFAWCHVVMAFTTAACVIFTCDESR